MPKAYTSLRDLLSDTPNNPTIRNAFVKSWSITSRYEKICCSISGGADSDILLDMIYRCTHERNINVTYVFIDTGIEMRATKDHINDLQEKYNIKIHTLKSWEWGSSVTRTILDYGEPFISKRVSTYIERLQQHSFNYEDAEFAELYSQYKFCKSALQWWTNSNIIFNINANKHLKNFMIQNKPTFRISAKCCDKSKKDVIHKFMSKHQYDLSINGVRRNEGSNRKIAYTSCFSEDEQHPWDSFRPIFWFSSSDRKTYENWYKIEHSIVYKPTCEGGYGLTRSGCSGCPFGQNREAELNALQKYEPQLYKAVMAIFKHSYAYESKYKAFRQLKSDTYHQYTFDELTLE